MPIFIAFTCCLVLNAASQLLEDASPALAATLNPLNTDARVNALVSELNTGTTPVDALVAEAQGLVALSSADARTYSLVGAIAERRGDTADAVASYSAALGHSRTERYALTRMLSLSLAEGDAATATRYFDLLLRRWSEFAPEIVPIAFELIAQPEGAAALRAALERDPAWRRGTLRQLIQRPDGLRFVSDLLLGSPVRARRWSEELASTINALIRLGAPGQAYLLFQQTLTPDEAAKAGYIYDPGFTMAPGPREFEWSASNSSFVDMSFPAASDTGGLRIRFLQSPAKLGKPQQGLYLPAGDYVLSTTARGSGLKLPKGLYWRLRCVTPRSELARLEFDAGTYDAKTSTLAFTVPAACALQSLTLETGVTGDSWRDRYDGDITITDVHISRAGAGA